MQTLCKYEFNSFFSCSDESAQLSVQYVWQAVFEEHFTKYTHEISSEYEDKTVSALSDGLCGNEKFNSPFENTCKFEF